MVKSALSNSFVPNAFWKVALYIRLSVEDYDNEAGKNSTSVQNQRVILRNYCKENGLLIVNEYVDDGYSGTNFNRPGFNALLDAIKKKEVNCVITKDLSRLGRNHLEVGYYIETFFPENRVRYIAINDRYDSLSGDDDIVPFMNILNEMAAKQTSKKNRQVFESKFSNGGMHSCHVVYGYLKDPQDKNHRIIDHEVIDVVRKIFDMADYGSGPVIIQQWLFDQRIECPSYRIYLQSGMYADLYADCQEDRKYRWNLSMIRRMLSDQTYLGHSVHYKKRTISYKNKKQVYYPEDQWMIIENTHEPIISQDQFDRVQNVIGSRKRRSKSGEVGLFAGLLKCSDCGCALSRYGREGKTMNRNYYVCGKHAQRDVYFKCTPHYTMEQSLSDAILSRIQKLFTEAKLDKGALVKKLIKANQSSHAKTSCSHKEDAASLEKRLKVLNKLIAKLYEDWATEVITEENFVSLSKTYQEEQSACLEKIKEIQRSSHQKKDEEDSVRQFVDIIDHLSYPDKLTRELLFSLISKIVAHEPIKNEAGDRNIGQEIDIYWKYIGLN